MKKSKKSNILKSLAKRLVIYGMSLILMGTGVRSYAYKHSDQAIFDAVVQIKGVSGSCSGEQIRAPSGKHYILTAGHCRPLVEDGMGKIITEDGEEHAAVMIAEDPYSDLLLLQGISGVAILDIAKRSEHRQEVRTYTHGAGLKAYKTEGVLIDDRMVDIMIDIVMLPEEMEACVSMPKHRLAMMYDFIPICVMSVEETVSTAFTAPGSSGGAVVDDNGEIVGVVSAGGGGYSLFVRLADIHAFLSDK